MKQICYVILCYEPEDQLRKIPSFCVLHENHCNSQLNVDSAFHPPKDGN